MTIEVEDADSGFKTIEEYTPLSDLHSPAVTDLLYQVNRPRESQVVPDMQINRLTKWSVIRYGVMSIVIGPAEQEIESSSAALAARLEMDINTAAVAIVQSDRIGLTNMIFGELMRLGAEIAREGDTP